MIAALEIPFVHAALTVTFLITEWVCPPHIHFVGIVFYEYWNEMIIPCHADSIQDTPTLLCMHHVSQECAMYCEN